MLISRLVAFLFVLLVALFVGLATAFRDPSDSATRLPAELDVQNIEIATETFDALAPAYAPFDANDAGGSTRSVVSETLANLILSDLDVPLDEAEVSDLVQQAVDAGITEEDILAFNAILSPEEAEGEDTPSENEEPASTNVLVLSEDEQRIANFGDAVGEKAVEVLIGLQSTDGPLATALENAGAEALTSAIRPRLIRLQRVAFEEIPLETYTPTVEVSGSTAVNRRSEVRARTGSTVQQILVDRGDQVAEGQVLLILDEDGRDAQRLQAVAGIAQAEAGLAQSNANLVSAQASIVSAEAQLSQAETSLSDAEEAQADILELGDFASAAQRRNAASAVNQAAQSVEVAKSGLAQAQAGLGQAQAGLAQAEATLESSRASLVQIDLDIERLQVKAPFAGRIENRFVELGSSANPGDILFTLTDVSTMLAKAQVSDAVRKTLAIGDMAEVRIGSGEDAIMAQGPITLIDSTSNAATRTFEVEVELENTFGADGQPLIVDNQFATVFFHQEEEQLFRIPQSSLTSASISAQPDGATGILMVDEDNHVAFTEISFADYNEGGELLIRADRLGEGPIRLIVGRGGFVSIGDQVDARAVLKSEEES